MDPDSVSALKIIPSLIIAIGIGITAGALVNVIAPGAISAGLGVLAAGIGLVGAYIFVGSLVEDGLNKLGWKRARTTGYKMVWIWEQPDASERT